MTAKTRRRLLVCVVAMVLTLPIETILLRVISTPDSKQAVRHWVTRLDGDRLDAAAGQIQQYPLAYRHEIMRALAAGRRAEVWREHITNYRDGHPGLDAATVAVLDAAIAIVTPELFSAPSPADRAQVKRIGDQLVALIGREEAEYVLYRLGPRDGRFASLEPMAERAANWIRSVVVAFANSDDCECSTEWGCGGGTVCKGGTGCNPDSEWPACGWMWNDTCDGVCRGGVSG